MDNTISVVLTSCNRPRELFITLKSFFDFNTAPIENIIIIDDSGEVGCIDESIKVIPDNVSKTIIYNNTNIGQIKSIDKAYSLVNTEYIFHCEDDWEFYHSGFIEKSVQILKQDEHLFCVWLRPYQHYRVLDNGHPVEATIYNDSFRLMGVFQERTNIWSGFTFNPGLRRTKDCKLLMPYQQFINSQKCNVGGVEQALSHLYFEKGYRAAVTLNERGYVQHIGWNNSTQHNS